MSQDSVFRQVMRQASVPKDVAMAIEMAVLEADLIGWDGDELGRRLIWWRDRKVKQSCEAIRRQLGPQRKGPPRQANQVAEALDIETLPPAPLPPRTVGLPDVQLPSSVKYPSDVEGQQPLPFDPDPLT